MFQVKGRDLHPRTRYDMRTYTAYAVDQTNPVKTLFLIWHDAWVWAEAKWFEPVEEKTSA